ESGGRTDVMERYDLEFRDLLMRNKQRIYYQLHRLNINDTHQEFYQEGLVAMWDAYRTYKADKGPFATYFNYTIRYRMIDLLRHENCYERLPPRTGVSTDAVKGWGRETRKKLRKLWDVEGDEIRRNTKSE